MFGSILGGLGVKIAMAAVLALAVGAFIWHYNTLRADRDIALANIEQLKTANKVQEETINSLQKVNNEWKTTLEQFELTLIVMAEKQIEANAQTRKLNDVLSRHNLTALSLAKPGLIENRINSGTADVLRMFESESGRN